TLIFLSAPHGQLDVAPALGGGGGFARSRGSGGRAAGSSAGRSAAGSQRAGRSRSAHCREELTAGNQLFHSASSPSCVWMKSPFLRNCRCAHFAQFTGFSCATIEYRKSARVSMYRFTYNSNKHMVILTHNRPLF